MTTSPDIDAAVAVRLDWRAGQDDEFIPGPTQVVDTRHTGYVQVVNGALGWEKYRLVEDGSAAGEPAPAAEPEPAAMALDDDEEAAPN